MAFRSKWLRRFSSSARTNRSRNRWCHCPERLALEMLEDRTVPSTAAFSAGSLTWSGFSTSTLNNATISVSGANLVLNDTAETITLAAPPAGWSGSGTNTVQGPLSAVTGSVTIDGGDDMTNADVLTIGGAVAISFSASFMVTHFTTIQVNESFTAAGPVTVDADVNGASTLAFGAGVAVDADVQNYRAGDGTGTVATANLVSNAPSFKDAAGTASPTNFSFEQDASIADANIPNASQFVANTPPANYFITSDGGSLTLSTDTKVHGSDLTLSAGTDLTLGGASTLMPSQIQATSGTAGAGNITVTGLGITAVSALNLDAGTGMITQNAGAPLISLVTAVTLTADTISVGAMITGPTGITLQPTTNAQTIGIGNGAAGIFNLNQTELDFLSTPATVTIGTPGGSGAIDIEALTVAYNLTVQGGSITENGKMTLPAAGTLQLISNGSITINGNIDPATVVISAATDVTISGSVTATDSIMVTAGTSGLGMITVTGTGSVTQTVSGHAGIQFLTAGFGVGSGSININAGGLVMAADTVSLMTSSITGDIIVDGSVSGVGATLGANRAITISGSVSGGSGTVAITANTNVAINGGTVTTTGNVDITSFNGSVTETAGGVIDGATLTVNAATGINLPSNNAVTGLNSTDSTGGTSFRNVIGTLTITGIGEFGGSVTVLNTGAITTSGAVSATTSISLTATGLLTIGANVTSTGAGPIMLIGVGVSQTTGTVNGGSGTITVDGGAAAINLSGTLTTTSASATAILIHHATTIALGNLSAVNGTVAIGTAPDISGAVTQNAATSIVSNALTASTANSINLNLANNIRTLGTVVRGGFLFFNDTGVLTVTGPITGGTITNAVTIQTSGSLAINGNISTAGANNVTLTGTSVTQIAASTVNAGAGTITIDAGAALVNLAGTLTTTSASAMAITIRHATTVALGTINAVNGTVVIGAAQDVTGAVTQNVGTSINASVVTASTSSSINLGNVTNMIATLGAITANGSLLVNNAIALAVTGPVNTGANSVTINAGVGGAGALAINGNITSTAGNVSLSGVGVTQSASSTVSAGSGTISVLAGTGAINLAGTFTTNNSGATAISIGNASTVALGNLTALAGTVVLGNAQNISGALTQNGGTSIHASIVTASTNGSITLNSPTNSFATLGSVARGGDIVVNDATALVVTGPVNLGTITNNVTITAAGTVTVNGPIAATGAGQIMITATGATSDIAVNAAISTASGTITLTAGRAISEGGAGAVSGAALVTVSTAGTTLTNGNGVGSFNATNGASGPITLVNTANPLTITGISQGNAAAVAVNNTGAINIAGTISTPGSVTLTSSAAIAEVGSGFIMITGASSPLSTTSAGGTALGNLNFVPVFTAVNTVGGNILLNNDPATLTLTGINQTGGGSVIITNVGSIVVANPINVAAPGGISLTANGAASDLIVNAPLNCPGGTLLAMVGRNATLNNAPIAATGASISGTGTLTVAYTVNNTWLLGGTNAGVVGNSLIVVPPGLSFSGFPNLVGGSANDGFNFFDGARITGKIDGGPSGTDTLNWSAYTTPRIVQITGLGTTHGFMGAETGSPPSLPSFDNIDFIIGAGAAPSGSTLTGPDFDNLWNIAGTNSGTLTTPNPGGRVLPFSGFANLRGGTQADTFVFGPSGVLTGFIDGGATVAGKTDSVGWAAYPTARTIALTGASGHGFSGNDLSAASSLASFTNVDQLTGSNVGGNTLIGPNASNTWNITSANSGTLASSNHRLAFTNFQNLTGGNQDDDFIVGPAGSLSGAVNGGGTGAGQFDVIDLSALATDRNVILTGPSALHGLAGTEATVGGGFANIDRIIATNSTFANTLTGDNNTSTWLVGASNGNGNGVYTDNGHALNFVNFQVLNGGSGANTFNVISTPAGITTTINGFTGSRAFGSNDVFNLGTDGTVSGTKTLDGLVGPLTINAGSHDGEAMPIMCGNVAYALTPVGNALYIDDQGNPRNVTYTLNETTFVRDMIAKVTFSGMKYIKLNGGSGNDSFFVALSMDETIQVIGGSGSNQLTFTNLNMAPAPQLTSMFVIAPPFTTVCFENIQNLTQVTSFTVSATLATDNTGAQQIVLALGNSLFLTTGAQINFMLPAVVASPTFSNPFGFSPPSVAIGRVQGNSIPDIIIGLGGGFAPLVTVFDGQSIFLTRGAGPARIVAQFFAYNSTFVGGVFVAAGNLFPGGKASIVTGAGQGGGPHVEVFNFNSSLYNATVFPGGGVTLARSFMAFPETPFFGGVRVAAGDVNGDGVDDIITGAGPGGGPHVRVFDGKGDGSVSSVIQSFFAYAPSVTSGVFVAAGNYANHADGHVDIMTAPGFGSAPHVQIFDGQSLAVIASFFAFNPVPADGVGGISFATAQSGTGLDIVAGSGQNRPAVVRTIPGTGGEPATLANATPANPMDTALLAPLNEFLSGVGVFVGGFPIKRGG